MTQRIPWIVCPQCGWTSHHPIDVIERYCGRCHAFHADMALSQVAHSPRVEAIP